MNVSRIIDTPGEAEGSGDLPLPATEIHLWLAFYDQIPEERLHDRYRQLLGAAERRQELRFYFSRDRRRYLVTRALVRTVLSRYVPLAPQEWMFSANAYGRPEIANREARAAHLSFNISHTHSLIVLGVTLGRALGVDVESLAAREATMDIAERYFAPSEVSALRAAPPHERHYRFFEYWTLKEAYVKARGKGLSLPLEKFSFRYPDDRTVEIAFEPELADDPARWQLWSFRPHRSDYLVAVCAERAGGPPPCLTVRQVIPMVSDGRCALEILRTSRRDADVSMPRPRW